PSPGHLLLAIDYSFIELRTLAVVCEARFGFSKLGDTIRAGIDPHCYTAAMLLGMTLPEFMALANTVDEVEIDGRPVRRKGYWFEQYRQAAKAVNFGVPGGLCARSLVSYAQSTFGITMTIQEAEERRRMLIDTIYPELNDRDGYLADDGMAILARNLKARVHDCWEGLDWKDGRNPGIVKAVQNLVRGSATKADGSAYNASFVRRTWETLADLNRNGDPRLTEMLESRKGGAELHHLLFDQAVTTLTGRVRGGVSYTQARNTPFQS